ncbi:MAG TPA: NADH-quinone oxidoreductase subunit A [Candidatus Acidoferrales bacterium]|nr:NADH-quinone oxidoreductase subunit A [Candidatus Acidoferrales bacterium]
MHDPYFPLVILFLAAGGVVGTLLWLAETLGPKKSNPAKLQPFESGNPPLGDARVQFSVRFYLVAMLFLIFDIEVVFLYPWAIVLRQLGWSALIEMGIFLSILVVALVYVWKKRALEWD